MTIEINQEQAADDSATVEKTETTESTEKTEVTETDSDDE